MLGKVESGKNIVQRPSKRFQHRPNSRPKISQKSIAANWNSFKSLIVCAWLSMNITNEVVCKQEISIKINCWG